MLYSVCMRIGIKIRLFFVDLHHSSIKSHIGTIAMSRLGINGNRDQTSPMQSCDLNEIQLEER